MTWSRDDSEAAGTRSFVNTFVLMVLRDRGNRLMPAQFRMLSEMRGDPGAQV